MKRLALLLGVVVICACSMSKDVDIARRAAEEFHQQVAAGQDDTVYDAADLAYKESVSRETNHAFFLRIRRKMGVFKSNKNTSYFLNKTTNGTFVRLQYKTECANGDLDEEFLWRIEGAHAVLVRYQANNPLLLTD
jgi:hypothetical protein